MFKGLLSTEIILTDFYNIKKKYENVEKVYVLKELFVEWKIKVSKDRDSNGSCYFYTFAPRLKCFSAHL